MIKKIIVFILVVVFICAAAYAGFRARTYVLEGFRSTYTTGNIKYKLPGEFSDYTPEGSKVSTYHSGKTMTMVLISKASKRSMENMDGDIYEGTLNGYKYKRREKKSRDMKKLSSFISKSGDTYKIVLKTMCPDTVSLLTTWDIIVSSIE